MSAALVPGSGFSGSYTSLTGPTITIPGYTPVEGHVVVLQVHSTSTSVNGTGITGSTWVNSGSGIRNATDNSMSAVMILHVITADEALAGTNSWNLAGLFLGNETGVYHGLVVSGADTTALIDAFAVGFNEDEVAGTTQLVGLAGADLLTDSLVVSAVQADNPARTFTAPSGFTQASAGAGGWIGVRNTSTTAGVSVPNTTIAMDVLDETISFSVALKSADSGTTPPVANAGADQDELEPFSTATLTGSGSTDSDGTIIAHAWTQIDGPTVTLINDDAAVCTYEVPGTIDGDSATFRLTVTDDDSQTDTDDVVHTWLPHTWFVIDDPLVPVRATLIT